MDRVWRAITDIATEENLAFMIGDAKLVTEANYATGTLAIAGGVNVTLSGGLWDAAWTKRQIVIQGRGERYGITITGAGTGTLDSTWQGTTTTGLTYRMFRDTYSLPSDCAFGKEIVLFDVAANVPMEFVDYETFTHDRQERRWSSTAGIPTGIARGGLDSSGLPQLVFDPPPGSARVYNLSYFRSPKRPALVTSALDPPWPDDFHDVIPLRAAEEWAARKGHPRRAEMRERLKPRMRKMRAAFDGGNELRRRLGGASERGVITLWGGEYST